MQTILSDIDGTVSNNLHRQHFLNNKKDWKNFFINSKDDKPILPIIEKINSFQKKYFEIIFISGRPEEYRQITETWLRKYFNFEFEILMRPEKDKRDNVEVKKYLFNFHLKDREIKLVFENDEDLCSLWRSKGLEVFKVDRSFLEQHSF